MDYTLFEVRPGISVLLLPDAPRFTIVAVSQDFIRATGVKKSDAIGKGLFEHFPENPLDPHFTGIQQLQASFQSVLRTKEPHHVAQQRYDIPNGNGSFSEMYWKWINVPVLDEEGNVRHIIHTAEDITLQVKALQQIEAVKGLEKAYQLFMQAPVAVCIVQGPEHIVELVNEQMLKFLGRTPEMVGKPLVQSLTEANQQGLLTILNHVQLTASSYHVDCFPASLIIDGVRHQRYFDLVFKPYFTLESDRIPAGVFCVAHNITAQIESQKKLEDSEFRFRTLIEDASVATAFYVGPDIRIEYANNIMLGYWGKDPSILGLPLQEAVPELKGQPFLGYLRQVYTTGEPYIGIEEEAWLEVDGRLQPYYFNFTYKALRDQEGAIYGIHQMAVDVTEAVRSRQAIEQGRSDLQLALEIAELGTFQVDLQNYTGTFSTRIQKWLGFETDTLSMDIILGSIHPEDQQYVLKGVEATLTLGVNNRHDLTYRVVGEDGCLRHLRSFGHTFFDRNGRAVEIRGVIQNVTAEMMQQERMKENEALLQKAVAERTRELQTLNGALERSNQSLGQFAHVASHDLKEPIRKIKFFTERLQDQLTQRLGSDLPEGATIDKIIKATGRMNALIEDLLNYSFVSQHPFQFEEVDLNALLERLQEDLEVDIETKHARITTGQLPVVAGNKRQLQQLFQNLLSNALKYCKEDIAPQISIDAKEVIGTSLSSRLPDIDHATTYHLITVLDNGIGFEMEESEKIFGMFHRLHGNAEYSGTGVGLSIVRKVMDNHHGYVYAESQPGDGARFSLVFPIHPSS